MTRTLVSLAAALLAAAPLAHGAIVVSAPFQNYQQNFDTLAATGTTAAWTNDVTLAGWSLFQSPAAPVTAYTVGTGSGTTGAFYSFGSAGSTERALGGVGSGPFNTAGNAYIAAQFTNLSGVALNGFTVAFDGEQWRNGGNASQAAQTMVMEYGFGTTFATVGAWQAPGAGFNWSSPVTTATAGAVVGNSVGRVPGVGGTINTNWAPGTSLWLRWIEQNDTGNDHALAIDNVVFSAGADVPAAVPLPAAAWLMAPGLAALAALARRRR